MNQLQITNPLKTFLFLALITFVLVASILIFTLSSANGSGSTPAPAITLSDDGNTGLLNPGEQHWFKFTRQGNNIQQPLWLAFTPNNGNTVNFISLTTFENNQIQYFANSTTANMSTFGQGQIITQDDDPKTGELFWLGTVSEPATASAASTLSCLKATPCAIGRLITVLTLSPLAVVAWSVETGAWKRANFYGRGKYWAATNTLCASAMKVMLS